MEHSISGSVWCTCSDFLYKSERPPGTSEVPEVSLLLVSWKFAKKDVVHSSSLMQAHVALACACGHAGAGEQGGGRWDS